MPAEQWHRVGLLPRLLRGSDAGSAAHGSKQAWWQPASCTGTMSGPHPDSLANLSCPPAPPC